MLIARCFAVLLSATALSCGGTPKAHDGPDDATSSPPLSGFPSGRLSIVPGVFVKYISSRTAVAPNLLIAADSQLHNMYGAPLAIGGGLADRMARVAIRPPQLDYWSSDVLKLLFKQARRGTGRDLLFLGDVANVACTNEFDRWVEAVGAEDMNVIMAPGNHDMLLYGNGAWNLRDAESRQMVPTPQTVMARDPIADDAGRVGLVFRNAYVRFRRFLRNAFGTKPAVTPWLPYFTWADGCRVATPQTPSAPWSVVLNEAMNKRTLLERYSALLLRRDGRETSVETVQRSDFCGRIRTWTVTGSPGDLLQFADFTVCEKMPSASTLFQVIDVDGVTIVVLDTAVYDKPRVLSGPLDVNTYAGTHAGTLSEQIGRLSNLKGRPFVAAGHHPLGEWSRSDREKLAGTAGVLAYISAHRHQGLNFSLHGSMSVQQNQDEVKALLEVNVGSTTDWPMEIVASRIAPVDGGASIAVQAVRFRGQTGRCDASGRDSARRYTHYSTKSEYFESLLMTLRDHAGSLGLTDDEVMSVNAALAHSGGGRTRHAAMIGVAQRLQADHRQQDAWQEFGACQARWASEAEANTIDVNSLGDVSPADYCDEPPPQTFVLRAVDGAQEPPPFGE